MVFKYSKICGRQAIRSILDVRLGILIRLPVNIYLFRSNNRNNKKRCKICSKLTKKTPERNHWHRSGGLIVNFEHMLHFFLVFLLLALSKKLLAGYWQKMKNLKVDINDTWFQQTLVLQNLLQLIIKETYGTPLKIYKYITNKLFTWKQ